MPEQTEQREYMTFAQTDAICTEFDRFLHGEIGISELIAGDLKAWAHNVTPYDLYVHPSWRPKVEREKAKARGAGA